MQMQENLRCREVETDLACLNLLWFVHHSFESLFYLYRGLSQVNKTCMQSLFLHVLHSAMLKCHGPASFKISDTFARLKEAFCKSVSCKQVFETDTTSTDTSNSSQSSETQPGVLKCTAALTLDLLHRDKATCPRGPPRGWSPKSLATCQILWLTFLPGTHLAALSTGGCRETGGPQTELLKGTLTVSFIAANNETGERRSWTCEFPPLSPSRSTSSSLRQREEKDSVCVCVWEIKTQRQRKRQCGGGRNREKKSTGGGDLEQFPWQGYLCFLVVVFFS